MNFHTPPTQVQQILTSNTGRVDDGPGGDDPSEGQ